MTSECIFNVVFLYEQYLQADQKLKHSVLPVSYANACHVSIFSLEIVILRKLTQSKKISKKYQGLYTATMRLSDIEVGTSRNTVSINTENNLKDHILFISSLIFELGTNHVFC